MNIRICDYCGERVGLHVVELTNRPNNESASAEICSTCASDIAKAVNKTPMIKLDHEIEEDVIYYGITEREIENLLVASLYGYKEWREWNDGDENAYVSYLNPTVREMTKKEIEEIPEV